MEWAPQAKEEKLDFSIKKINLGESLQLKCPVEANPAPHFLWYHEGEKIDDIVLISNLRRIRALFICFLLLTFQRFEI